MANEYLKRTPTSTGNRKVFTWAGWLKLNSLSTSYTPVMEAFTGASDVYCTIAISSNSIRINQDNGAGGVLQVQASPLHRDPSSWFHLLVSVDTTQTLAQNRIRIYVNGDEEVVTYSTTPSINFETHFNRTGGHRIGARWTPSTYYNGQLVDAFLIDGQALTPDVFGFYKEGKGYISAGSTQATDFRPGQWVPKTPRIIKSEIERRGGFGVNGFYLPMNDSSNFGADFHTTPNSIITLKGEDLPQPRNGAPTTTDAYVSQLRTDPYAANLVLAVPGISGGTSSGYGDYSADIKGSGSNKTLTANGNAGVALVPSYYGSALSFDGSGDYLSRTYDADFNFGTSDFAVEMWVYPNTVNSIDGLFAVSGGSGGNPKMAFHLNNGTPSVHYNNLTGAADIYTASSTAIPAGQWSHLAYERKGSTWTWYINGVATGTGSNSTDITFTSQPMYIGYGGEAYFDSLDGKIQDLRIYKGVAKYKGGFDVPKPYTPVGIATWRAVPDTTANNFATLNPLITRVASGTAYPLTFTDGNLTATANAAADTGNSCGIAVTSGKWYAEYRINTNNASGSYRFTISINPADRHWGMGNGGDQTGSIHFRPYNAQLSSVSGLTFSTIYTLNYTIAIGDIIGVSLDMDNRQVSFYKNGTLIAQSGGAAAFPYSFSGINSTSPYGFGLDIQGTGANQLTLNFGQNPTFSGNTTAGTFTDSNGKGLFKYQPPSGFLALCEDNLPTPAIADPGEYFKTVLWTGDGNSSRSIVGVGFTPDLVWSKNRTGTQWHLLTNSVIGPARNLFSNATNAEATTDSAGYLNSFNYDGFSVQTGSSDITNLNASGQNYVAWCWRAGAGTTSTNTDGSITSVVSVNQTAGFSIVSYTGNGTAGATVGHGLNKNVEMYFVKNRSTSANWAVLGHTLNKAGGGNRYLLLHSTNGFGVASQGPGDSQTIELWNDSSNNTSGNDYIAYCWAEIEGFSKFGSYVGNGSADGPFVWTGFKPAFILIKNTGATADWLLHDSSRTSTNPSTKALKPNASQIEIDIPGTTDIDFLSNGFKVRNTDGGYNNLQTYIFAAFAESPFSYSNAK